MYAPVNNLIVSKPHVRLRGVHVYVYDFRGNIQKEHKKRILSLHKICAVSVRDRRRNRLVDDESSVYKQALITAVRLGKILIPQISVNAYPVLFGRNFIALFHRARTVHRGKRRFGTIAVGAVFKFSVHIVGKGDLRAGEKKTRHHIGDFPLFLHIRFQKFQPRRRIEK